MIDLRVATLGFLYEANTFSSFKADWADLEAAGILRSKEIVTRHGESRSSMSGFLAAGREIPGIEVVPLVLCNLPRGGVIVGDAFARFVRLMVDELRAKGPWDAVLLALHGAAVSESTPDADGQILRVVRDAVGERIPIGVTLDLHANISEEMIRCSTVTAVYRTNPHVDARERALACANLVASTARGRFAPVQALVKVPLVPHILCHGTSDEPLNQIMPTLQRLESEPQILSADVALGFPYADTSDLGMATIVVGDRDLGAVQANAAALARLVWTQRNSFWTDMLTIEEALRLAKDGPHPVLLLDVGDNVGAGGPADSTHLLEAALQHGLEGWLETLHDPESVAVCERAGVGGTVTISVGGKTDESHGRPVRVTGSVDRMSDGRFYDSSPTHGGERYFDAGTTAVVRCAGGMSLVLTSRRLPNTSLNQMRSIGIDPAKFKVIVAKGVIAPRAAYGRVAKRIVAADTPGVTRGDFTRLAYRRRPRPMFPFEQDIKFIP